MDSWSSTMLIALTSILTLITLTVFEGETELSRKTANLHEASINTRLSRIEPSDLFTIASYNENEIISIEYNKRDLDIILENIYTLIDGVIYKGQVYSSNTLVLKEGKYRLKLNTIDNTVEVI